MVDEESDGGLLIRYSRTEVAVRKGGWQADALSRAGYHTLLARIDGFTEPTGKHW